jgi:hypothetical protein
MKNAKGDAKPPSPEQIARMQDQLLKMAECMRGKGYDYPDPEVSSDGGVKIRNKGIVGDDGAKNPDRDKKMEDDQNACDQAAGLDHNGPGGSTGGKK